MKCSNNVWKNRTFLVGKTEGYGYKRKCSVEIDVELQNLSKGIVLSISGNVWNPNRSDIVMGGQCLDDIKESFPNDQLVDFLYDMWNSYHLNDLHAGTPEQETALTLAVALNKLPGMGANYYKECCEYLKSINLYEVEHNGKPYRYGAAWLFEEIPLEDLARIVHLIDTGELMEKDDSRLQLLMEDVDFAIKELYREEELERE